MKILYSETSLKTLDTIIEYLELKWSDKQIEFLKKEILKFEEVVKDRIISHQTLSDDTEVKFMLIAKKQVNVYYEKTEDDIKVLAFWPSKGNPATLRKILK